MLEKLGLLTQEVFAMSRSRNGDAAMLFAPQSLRAISSVQTAHGDRTSLALRIKTAFDPQNTFATSHMS